MECSPFIEKICSRRAILCHAERLWTPLEKLAKDPKLVTGRLARFRCLLNQRGVAAAPLAGFGRDAPYGPGSCYKQQRTLAPKEFIPLVHPAAWQCLLQTNIAGNIEPRRFPGGITVIVSGGVVLPFFFPFAPKDHNHCFRSRFFTCTSWTFQNQGSCLSWAVVEFLTSFCFMSPNIFQQLACLQFLCFYKCLFICHESRKKFYVHNMNKSFLVIPSPQYVP